MIQLAWRFLIHQKNSTLVEGAAAECGSSAKARSNKRIASVWRRAAELLPSCPARAQTALSPDAALGQLIVQGCGSHLDC